MAQRPRCLIGTAVWGAWHVDAFLKLNLATLLAPSNLPAFAREIDTTYMIYTRIEDADRMRTSPSFNALEELLPVEIESLSAQAIGEPIETHQRIWHELIQRATARGSYVMLMPPDVAWSCGSLSHLGELIRSGKKALFLNWHLRSVGDTFIPTFLERYRDQHPLEIPARDLVRLALEHAHPICGASLRHSRNFPHHPEMIFWPVRDQGLLMHVLALTPFVFDPASISLGPTKLLAAARDPNDLHFVADSDDVFMVSLAEIGKDAEWYRDNHPLDSISVAKWWLYYDSPMNDLLAAAPFRLRFAEIVKSDWRREEISARVVIQRLVATREALRLWQLVKEMGCNLAAAMLAYALEQGLARRLIPSEQPLLLLVPDDAGMRSQWEGELGELLCPSRHNELIHLLRRHCLAGERALHVWKYLDSFLSTQQGGHDGARAALGLAFARLEIDGVLLRSGPHQAHGYYACVIERPLPPPDSEAGVAK